MNIDGKQNGTYNNTELAFPSVLTTTDPKLGYFMHTLRSNIYSERTLVFIDGKILMCDKNWIRDHVHVMKAIYSPAKNIKAHILMPKDKSCSKLLVNSSETDFVKNSVGNSAYIDFDIEDIHTQSVSIEIIF